MIFWWDCNDFIFIRFTKRKIFYAGASVLCIQGPVAFSPLWHFIVTPPTLTFFSDVLDARDRIVGRRYRSEREKKKSNNEPSTVLLRRTYVGITAERYLINYHSSTRSRILIRYYNNSLSRLNRKRKMAIYPRGDRLSRLLILFITSMLCVHPCFIAARTL